MRIRFSVLTLPSPCSRRAIVLRSTPARSASWACVRPRSFRQLLTSPPTASSARRTGKGTRCRFVVVFNDMVPSIAYLMFARKCFVIDNDRCEGLYKISSDGPLDSVSASQRHRLGLGITKVDDQAVLDSLVSAQIEVSSTSIPCSRNIAASSPWSVGSRRPNPAKQPWRVTPVGPGR